MQPMEANGGPYAGAGGCMKEAMGIPWWRKFLTGPVAWWRDKILHWNKFVVRTCDPVRNAHWISSWRAVISGKDPIREAQVEMSPTRRTSCEHGKSMRKKEWIRQHVMNWLQPQFPIHMCHLGDNGREVRTEVEPRKKGRMVGGCFEIWSFSPYCFALIFLIINWINFFEFVLPMRVIAEWSLLVLISTTELFVLCGI